MAGPALANARPARAKPVAAAAAAASPPSTERRDSSDLTVLSLRHCVLTAWIMIALPVRRDVAGPSADAPPPGRSDRCARAPGLFPSLDGRRVSSRSTSSRATAPSGGTLLPSSDKRALDLRIEIGQTSLSPPPWLTLRPHHGHLGVSDGTGLRQPGQSTGSTPGPVRPPRPQPVRRQNRVRLALDGCPESSDKLELEGTGWRGPVAGKRGRSWTTPRVGRSGDADHRLRGSG